jgi:hypothetical protein
VDIPIAGAVGYVRAVHATGSRVCYVTGRHEAMREGTLASFRAAGFPLPDGEIMASYAANVANPAGDTPRYDLMAVDPQTHGRRMLLAGGMQSLVEATLSSKRSSRLLFRNTLQLVFGGRRGAGAGDKATVHFPDLPMLATLLDANLRRGRNVAAFAGAASLAVHEVLPARSPSPDARKIMGTERVYTDRRRVGAAAVETDGSLKVQVPAGKPLVLELLDRSGGVLFTMREEHQLGPGESITPGVPRKLFNAVCGGCHGSVSGQETEVAVSADALTGASVSLSRDLAPKALR